MECSRRGHIDLCPQLPASEKTRADAEEGYIPMVCRAVCSCVALCVWLFSPIPAVPRRRPSQACSQADHDAR